LRVLIAGAGFEPTSKIGLPAQRPTVPVEWFVHYLSSAFFAVLIWWMDRRSRLTPSQIDEVFRPRPTRKNPAAEQEHTQLVAGGRSAGRIASSRRTHYLATVCDQLLRQVVFVDAGKADNHHPFQFSVEAPSEPSQQKAVQRIRVLK
jgi:hypothetical protein